MGTRHLTCVKLDGQYKIAQYGQWDGYPEGQGQTVLDFLKKWKRPVFESKLRAASFYDDYGIKALPTPWPAHISRDTGAEILKMVQDADPGIKLRNSLSFAGDSVFCEFAYVIDLDENTLEVLKGFNKVPLTEGDRFFGMELEKASEGYYPIKKVASYSLSKLPTIRKLCKDCETNDEEAEV